MYTLSYATPVNPAGADPVLARDQVWRGLEMKAENALPFVPGMSKCEVVERKDNMILRDVTFAGSSHRERILLHAPVQVQFERVGENGFIQNTISDSEAGLQLTFTFGLNFPGVTAGSPEEQAKGDEMKGAYIGAVAATLERVRQMVRNGEL
ncbi:MAG TPA: SRPBCC family protein [Sphingomonas sp.]|uniref:SRPBCC family protein n=1 Tax=Sphingomonas sp. TaxID=28214 RepID=UPI002BBBA5FC|nr:SRPBCC family protein [Sphingomonas sp.]HMI20243.1 SRPBCC family protein [Sphingomonas sp.]